MSDLQNLVPIKVKILLGPDGKHQYPPFNQLAPSLRGHLDWATFFDTHGIGWHYDRLSGFGVSDANDPQVPAGHEHSNTDPSCWYGVSCVPKPFADAAVAAFPALVSLMSEASLETFYDDRAHAHEETEILDKEDLLALKARIDLENEPNAPTTPPSAEILALRARMLDPNDPKRGIRKNRNRKWADFKVAKGLSIDQSQAKPGA